MLKIEDIVGDFEEKLTLDGRKKVFEDGRELSSAFLEVEASPEAVTRQFVINPIVSELGLEQLPEKHFKGAAGTRQADYVFQNEEGDRFFAEAKPVNANLTSSRRDSAVSQVKGLFRLAEVKENYSFGIATDGLRWIFIDQSGRISHDLDIRQDQELITRLLTGEEEVSTEKIEEEISQKFYDWYDALLHGGTYRDHDENRKSIAEDDCLVTNILRVSDEEEREQIAQTVMDRLIFIRFLQSKDIIDFDVLDYISDQPEDVLNAKLKELFLNVLNAKPGARPDVDSKFEDIPYLNGSLFLRTKVEAKNPDYHIKASILKEVIDFLDSFQFVHREDLTNRQVLDPEILGYIFERAMTAAERKNTGAYYTPRTITRYISEHTLHPVIIDRANEILREKGYKETELIEEIDQVYNLRETTLQEVFHDLVHNLSVCDNACGSGAFLLAAANSLLDVYTEINEELRLGNSEIALRKLILKNNLYGVDINPNAIEIAKLRLWLWLVDAYEADTIEPLPNLDYNIKTGNSLIGYVDIDRFAESKVTLKDWAGSKESLHALLKKRGKKIAEYKSASGKEAQSLHDDIEALDDEIESELDRNLFREVSAQTDLEWEEFQELEPFHWGFEFYEVFHEGNGQGGFDVILGNPPYVRQEGLMDIKDVLRERFEVYHGRADLYQYFFQRSMETLRDNGTFGYIVSNKWLRTGYGEPLREYLNQYRVEQFINFGDTEVFKGVSAYPCITVMKKSSEPNNQITAATIKTEDYDPLEIHMGQESYESSQEALTTDAWKFPPIELLELMRKIKESCDPLGEKVDDVYRGVLTGLNDAFVIDEETRDELIRKDPKSKEIIKPFLTGRYIRRYTLRDSGKYVIFTRRGINIDDYPAVKEYLSNWREELEPKDSRSDSGPGRKPGSYKWYEIQDTIDYWQELEKPKIIYGKLATGPRFAIDEEGEYYFNDASWMIRPVDKHLAAILNSKLGWFLITQTCTKIQNGYQLIWKYFQNVPIPNEKDQKLPELVDEIKKLKEQDASDEEIADVDAVIDARVFKLYGLSEEEIEAVLDSINVNPRYQGQILEYLRET